MDVKSIAKMYMLRADQRPVRIQDCSYLFVTSNRSLCMIASKYHKEIGYSDEILPCLFTDVFIGTYIWLDEPIKIIEMNQQQVFSNALLAFEPSTKVLSKLTLPSGGCVSSGEAYLYACKAINEAFDLPEKWQKPNKHAFTVLDEEYARLTAAIR